MDEWNLTYPLIMGCLKLFFADDLLNQCIMDILPLNLTAIY